MSFYTFMPTLLNMSLTASVAIVLVILLRLLLKKAPKVISYALWGVVLFRLLCPVSIGSSFSLYNLFDAPTEESGTVTSVIEYVPSNIVHTEYPSVAIPVPGISDAINEALPQGEEQLRADPLEGPIFISTYVWMAGVLAMVIYSIVSYIRLRRKLSVVVPLRDNIFIADDIKSPFVVGLFRPKIYLPCNLGDKEQEYIILHEQHHIKRLDHVMKALAFLALAIHWFNPLVWVAFILASKDMEMSCDEAVIRKIGGDVRADYSASLLTLATGRRIIAGTPLAFGEGDTKGRINNLSKWKKPAVWVVLLAVVACAVLAVCLLTNPKNDEPDTLPLLHSHSYGVVEVTYETSGTSFSMVAQQNTPVYAITDTMQLMSKGEHSSENEWTTLGILEETELTKENFDELFFSKGNWFGKETASGIRKDTANAWSLIYNQEVLYYVLQQKNGEVYLAYGYYDYSEKDDPGSDDTNIRWLFKLAYDLNEDTGIVATSGENVIPVIVFPVGTPLSDVKDGIHWLDIAPGPDDTVPFTILCDGQEQYGWYGVYDAETLESLDFMRPSGLSPQTYLFQNAQYGHDYIVTLRTEAGDLLCFGARIGVSTEPAAVVTKWVDYLETPDEMKWDGSVDINLPEFSDVTFRWSYGEIVAVKGNKTTSLYTGMPIWNTYFCDLSGDGLPELCSTISWGSGMIDNRVIIYDYANGVSYSLEDRGFSDYTLRQDESDGQLYVDKTAHVGGGLLSTGRLVFEDDCLQVFWPEKPNDNIREITDPTDDPNFAYDTAVEKIYEDDRNEYFISGLYSQHIIVQYTDGTQEDVVTALNAGRATFVDLDKFGIRYWAEPKGDELYSAILNAIRGRNKSDKPDGLLHCASFVMLKQESLAFDSDPPRPMEMIVYGIALHEAYGFSGHTFHGIEGSHIPTVITFEVINGEYVLKDYWTPRDGSYYASDVMDKFPDDIEDEALDTQKYVLAQKQECYDQAVRYGSVDTDYAVEYLLEVIESSPATSSSPSDYIDAHLSEYRELTYYGSYTLRYIFSRFLEGNQTGLRGHLMRAVLDDIAPEAQLRLYAETGQEYFDEWKAGAIRVSEQHDMDWIKANQPAIWLLLQMINE